MIDAFAFRSIRTFCLSLVAVSALGILACSKTPEPDPIANKGGATPSASVVASGGSHNASALPEATGAPNAATPGNEIAWTDPSAWKRVEHPSKMRLATYQVPKAPGDGEDAELSVTKAGGSIDMNVDRWAKQFGLDPKAAGAVTKTGKQLGTSKATVIEMKGTYSGSGMPGAPPTAPKTKYALLAGIVETGGGESYFFKLTGPEKTVAAAKPDFESMLGSIHPK